MDVAQHPLPQSFQNQANHQMPTWPNHGSPQLFNKPIYNVLDVHHYTLTFEVPAPAILALLLTFISFSLTTPPCFRASATCVHKRRVALNRLSEKLMVKNCSTPCCHGRETRIRQRQKHTDRDLLVEFSQSQEELYLLRSQMKRRSWVLDYWPLTSSPSSKRMDRERRNDRRKGGRGWK